MINYRVKLQMPRKQSLLSILLVAANCWLAVPAGAQPDPVPARWQPYQIKFHFSGFYTFYTCNGIETRMKTLIKALGARDDVRIESNCYKSSGRVQESHLLRIAFALPVPALSGDDPDEIFPARWSEVRYRRNHPRDLDGSDCELVEHFVKQVLPEINTRDVNFHAFCNPYGSRLSTPVVDMTVLLPLEEPPGPGAD